MVRAGTKEDKPQPRDHHGKVLAPVLGTCGNRFFQQSERSLNFDLSPPSSLDSLYTYGGAPASLTPPASLDTIYGPPPVESLPGDIDTLTAPAACHQDCQLLLSVIPNPLYRYQVSSRSPTPGLPSLQLCQVRKILLLNYLLSQQAFNTVLL